MYIFFFKQKTEYEMRISDWSSDVCSSDLTGVHHRGGNALQLEIGQNLGPADGLDRAGQQFVAERIDRRVELGQWQAMIDQADFFSALRGQQLARQQEFLGTAEADALCPDRRAATPRPQADAIGRASGRGQAGR